MPINIGEYHSDGELRTAGNGQVAAVESLSDGQRYFLKVFDKYVMPADEALATGHPAILRRKRRFEAYEERLRSINARLSSACGSTASLVVAKELFRDGCRLVKVSEFVEFDDRPAHELCRAYTREQVYQVFETVLTSVQTLHGQGIVHADIKPDNIFICREHGGGPDGAEREGALVGRLSDFDDSFFAHEVPDACDITSSLQYYSPELARYVSHAENPDDPLGKAGSRLARAVGRPHDIFALGLVLHVYLTGELPRVRGGGYVYEGLLRYGDAGVRTDPRLGRMDAALVRWMIRGDPAERPQTCTEVLNALHAGGRGIPCAETRLASAPAAPVAARASHAGGASHADRTVDLGVEVVRAGGAPVAGAWVGLRCPSGELVAGEADARGRVTFRGLPRRPMALCAYDPMVAAALPDRWRCAKTVKVPLERLKPGRDAAVLRIETRGVEKPDIVFDPPRAGRYASLTKVGSDRVLIVLTDGTTLHKPLRELGLYGMRDCVERLEGIHG